jgi:hypothetical protein
MKRLIIITAVIALVAVAVFGGQALAAKPTGSSVVMETLEGCFSALEYPDGYNGVFLQEEYPEIRHVSLTIAAIAFDAGVGDDQVMVVTRSNCSDQFFIIDASELTWDSRFTHFETHEFNTDNWEIWLTIPADSYAYYAYTVTVSYPR